MKQWGIAVIGCGNIAEFHLRALKEIENAWIAGVFSRSEERARKAAEAYHCDWSTQVEDLLQRKDVDIVHIATSSGSHAELARKALEHGKHVLVEKPITMRPEEADALIRLAHSRRLVLSVVSQRRYEPPLQAAKAAVDAGQLGRLLLIEARTPFFRTQQYYDSAPWRGKLAEDGGALMNQGIHQIDLLLWYGGKVQSVFGKTATQTHRMEAEDIGLALVEFENGCLGSIMSSTSLQPGSPAAIRIYGEKGSIEIEGGAITAWFVPGAAQPCPSDRIVSRGGASDPLSINYVHHKRQFVDLLHALDNGTSPQVTGEDGRRAVELIHMIYESARTGKEVR